MITTCPKCGYNYEAPTIICYCDIPWEQKWDDIKREAITICWKRRLIIDLYFVVLCFKWEKRVEDSPKGEGDKK